MSISYRILIALIILTIKCSSKGILDYSYKKEDPLYIQVGSLSSHTFPLPIDFYRLPLCRPEKIQKQEDNLGEILTGENIYNTLYQVKMMKNEYCKYLCVFNYTQKDVDYITKRNKQKYTTYWYLDKLPAGLIRYQLIDKEQFIQYNIGIPLGFTALNEDKSKEILYIYNHYQFKISVHKTVKGESEDDVLYEIVGFSILPLSIKQSTVSKCEISKETFDDNYKNEMQPLTEGEILFTYDVTFEESELTFASRWDYYKPSPNLKIHWFSVISSNVMILILSIVIFCIIFRVIEKDVNSYNIQVTSPDFIDEMGWKQVSGDVFRPPMNGIILCALIGTGVQLIFMIFLAIFYALFGFLKPEYRGQFITVLLIYFALMGFPSGYIACKFYRVMNGKSWLKLSVITACLFPSFVYVGYMTVNFFLIIEKSSASVGFIDIFYLLALWLGCSFPLNILGSFYGIKTRAYEIPCQINPVPTTLPDKPWYFNNIIFFFIAGFFSFSTIFIELMFFMQSVWKHQIYFLATFMYVELCLMITISTEITFLLVFLNLCKGDYLWWWKSFWFGGSPGVFMFIFSVFYYFLGLNIKSFSATVCYFGVMMLFSGIVVLVCGGTATAITFCILAKIYSMIKVD